MSEDAKTKEDLLREVEALHQRIAEAEKTASEYRLVVEALARISETAIEFVKLPPDRDVFEFVCQRLKVLVGNAAVAVNSYDAEKDLLQTRHVMGLPPEMLEAVNRLIGAQVPDISFSQIDPEIKDWLFSGKMHQVPEGIYGLFFHRVPKPACEEIERISGIRELYSLGFQNEGRLFGNATIMTFESTPPLNKDIIETFVNQASIVLERRGAEEALQKSEQRYHMLFENSPISLWEEDFSDVIRYLDELKGKGIEDLRGYLDENPEELLKLAKRVRILDINETTLKMFKAESKEAFLSGLDKFFTPESFDVFMEEVITLAEGKTSFESEAVNQTLAGEKRNVMLRWSPAPGHEKDLSRVLVSMIDVTDRKRIEEQFLQAQKMEAVGRFAAGVSHDLNNLLTAIIAYSDLLTDSLAEYDDLQTYVQEIREAVDKASGLTKQLVSFSRKQVLQPRLLDMNTVVASMEGMLRRLISEDIELVSMLAPDIGLVRADKGQLEQIVLNLAVNARDAMEQGGQLTIETANVNLDATYAGLHMDVTPGPHVMLAVSDSGCGMDEDTRSHMFEPFFTTKEQEKGTGLGLSTVFGIVKQHKGHIWVYSEPGQGTTLKIYFPKIMEEFETTEEDQVSIGALGGTETVLVVEDDEGVRKAVREILRKSGYKILSAHEPGEAILVAEQHTGLIHLMLSDVVMPRMSGPDLAERLNPWHPEMKILYVSGYADNAIVHHGILDKGLAFLQKPFALEELLQKVRQVLDSPKQTVK